MKRSLGEGYALKNKKESEKVGILDRLRSLVMISVALWLFLVVIQTYSQYGGSKCPMLAAYSTGSQVKAFPFIHDGCGRI